MDINLVYEISDSQIRQLHELYLKEWWTTERTIDDTRKIIKGSDIVIGITRQGLLIGFVRVLTDYCVKAFIFDMIVSSQYRGEGLGKKLMDEVFSHPDLQGVNHFELYCLPDMTPFYKNWGFTADVSGVVLMRAGEIQAK